MLQIEKRLNKYLVSFAVLILGILLGVLFCNWSYFEIKKEITLESFFILLISSLVSIYIGTSIQNAISNKTNSYNILSSEIHTLIINFSKIDCWIEERQIPFEVSKSFFKTISLEIMHLSKLFEKSDKSTSEKLNSIRSKFTQFQSTTTIKSPHSHQRPQRDRHPIGLHHFQWPGQGAYG